MSEIPRSMSYAMRKSSAVQANTTLRQFASNNGTIFTPTVNEIRINVAADGYLDGSKSYLYFTINNKNATGVAGNLTLDADALCWIDQIRVESQGLVLERLERAAIYSNLKSRWKDGVGQVPARNAKQGGPVSAASVGNDGLVIDEALSATFACKLPLGILNAHHGRAIPQGASFDIVIRVNSSAAQCFKWEDGTKTLFEITNPRFYAPVYRIENAEVMSEYSQALMERGIQWSGDVVKTYVNSMAAGAATRVAQINDRSMSLKSLVSVVRTNAIATSATDNSVGSSQLLGLSQMRYIISGQNYPQDSVQYSATDAGRLYEEAQKALAHDGDSYCEPTVSLASFTATTTAGQGVIAVDLRKFDDEKLLMTGMNTASTAAPNLLELLNVAAAAESDITTFAICDAVFTLDGRGAMSSAA
tara:strand:+ start:504 stop:1757 length:1254 start_codon:yes stop_codon:yes gene_type:complete